MITIKKENKKKILFGAFLITAIIGILFFTADAIDIKYWVTDHFDTTNPENNPEYYISSKQNIEVDGDQLKLTELPCDSNGQSCSDDIYCCSGNCVDGVCCNTLCGGQCESCNILGSEGSCVNIPQGQDPDNECSASAIVCTNYLYGWSGNRCTRYAGSSPNNGTCNGAGACYSGSISDSCAGVGGTLATCGSAGCKMSCPQNGLVGNYNQTSEVCYTSGQHGCSICTACNATGSCVNVPICQDCYGCGRYWSGSGDWCDGGRCVGCSWTWMGEFSNYSESGITKACNPYNDPSLGYKDNGPRRGIGDAPISSRKKSGGGPVSVYFCNCN